MDMEVNINSRLMGYGQTAPSDKVQETKAVQEENAPEQPTVETVEKPNQDVYEPSKGKVEHKLDAETVKRMKAELEVTQNRFLTMVRDMLGKQNKQIGLADDDLWKILSRGYMEVEGPDETVTQEPIKVDPEVQAAAQEAISADGYWGVEQTSQRLVGFAKALVGSDPERVEEMRAAFIKGYEAAGAVWGGQLPEITRQTYDATMKLFDEWAASGKEESEEASGVEAAVAAE